MAPKIELSIEEAAEIAQLEAEVKVMERRKHLRELREKRDRLISEGLDKVDPKYSK